MSAKEMFEELGYHLVYKDNIYVDYSLVKDPISDFETILQFDNFERTYRIWCYGEKRDEIIKFNLKLNKAIQKQIEELGWESDK